MPFGPPVQGWFQPTYTTASTNIYTAATTLQAMPSALPQPIHDGRQAPLDWLRSRVQEVVDVGALS